ncbi:MAG: hypothetical protein EBU52_17365 [Cytophagia bacterium]|nr:hypothetical protein [Cytophagia bacterium]
MMKLICLAHQKRGEEVVEFNLTPHYFNNYNREDVVFNNKSIPVISEGWNRIGDFYYLELITTNGIQFVTSLSYRLKK